MSFTLNQKNFRMLLDRYSWATETLHAIRILQTPYVEYIQNQIQAGFEEIENMANEVMRGTSHLRLSCVDELVVWGSLFQTAQNGENIESQRKQSTESEDVVFVGFSPPSTKNMFEMSRSTLEHFFAPAWDAVE